MSKFVLMSFFLLQLFVFQVVANDVFKGREIYTRECAACHGVFGEGRLPGLLSFKDSQILFRPDSALVDVVRDGKGIMPSFNGLLSHEDIRNVVVYLRTFL